MFQTLISIFFRPHNTNKRISPITLFGMHVMHSADPSNSRNQPKKPEPRPETRSQNPALAYS